MGKIPDNAKKVFEGVLFDVYHWEQEMFDGTKSTFENVSRIGSTQLLVITSENKIILYEEEQPSRGKFLGLPGGMVDDGEDPFVGAKRELLEELGMESSNFNLWKEKILDSKIVWPTYYYIVKDCKKVQEPRLDNGEKINPLELSFEDFLEKVESKEFANRQFSDMLFRIRHTNGELEKFKRELFE